MIDSLPEPEVLRRREDAMLYLADTNDELVGVAIVEGERVTFNTRSGRAIVVSPSGIRYYKPCLLEKLYLSTFRR